MPHPTQADIVIIGGGAVGCGVAYSLAKAGRTDVVVVEAERSNLMRLLVDPNPEIRMQGLALLAALG